MFEQDVSFSNTFAVHVMPVRRAISTISCFSTDLPHKFSGLHRRIMRLVQHFLCKSNHLVHIFLYKSNKKLTALQQTSSPVVDDFDGEDVSFVQVDGISGSDKRIMDLCASECARVCGCVFLPPTHV